MALTTGTVTVSNSTVQAFKVADAGILGINVTHNATLAKALSQKLIFFMIRLVKEKEDQVETR